MKPALLCMILFAFVALSPLKAQTAKNALDGKTYYITNYDVNHPDKKEKDTLNFQNGKVMSNQCTPYGFHTTSLKVTPQNGKTIFNCVCKSDKEGQITWDGTVDGKNITGTYLWHKAGQNDIKYAFSGVQK